MSLGASMNGDGGVIPYDVGSPQPKYTLPPPSKYGVDDHPAHEEIQVVAGGTAKNPPSRRLPGTHGVFP